MIDELLQYQEADGKLRAIEQEIASTEERKKYMTARKFLEKAPEKLEALDARASEFKIMFERLEKKYAEIADTIKDYENLDEMIDEQGGEIAFYKKNAAAISENLKNLKTEINKLVAQIEKTSAEYAAAKKQTIAMQRQYKEYKEKYAAVKEARAAEISAAEEELAKLAKEVPAETLAKYKAKRKEKVFPVVVEVTGNRCPQCGMELSIAEISKLTDGNFIECDSCRRILFGLTNEQKARLLYGKDFWYIDGEALGKIMLTDGPAGLRKQQGKADMAGINESLPATAYPAGCAAACSWDVSLMLRLGEALGRECKKEGVAVLLGPAR